MKMNLRASRFDAIANIYDGIIPSHVANHYLEKRVRLIRGLLPLGACILDVGCGTGTLAKRLQEGTYKVVGLDDSEGMLKTASEKDIKVIRAMAQNLPFPDGTFDGVISIAVLHHLVGQDLVFSAIREMLRVIRKRGTVVIWDHNPLNPYWPILMRQVPQDDGTERLVPLREILKAISRCNGVCVAHYRLGFVPDFTPSKLLPILQRIESHLECWWLTRWLAAHNVVVVRKE